MDGVNILNEFEVISKTAFSWESFWWGMLIGVCIALITAIIFGISEADWLAFWVGLGISGIIMGLVIGLLNGFVMNPRIVERETHYEVTIDETANMQEFMDRYEIIETRGSIYTVREKSE